MLGIRYYWLNNSSHAGFANLPLQENSWYTVILFQLRSVPAVQPPKTRFPHPSLSSFICEQSITAQNKPTTINPEHVMPALPPLYHDCPIARFPHSPHHPRPSLHLIMSVTKITSIPNCHPLEQVPRPSFPAPAWSFHIRYGSD